MTDLSNLSNDTKLLLKKHSVQELNREFLGMADDRMGSFLFSGKLKLALGFDA